MLAWGVNKYTTKLPKNKVLKLTSWYNYSNIWKPGAVYIIVVYSELSHMYSKHKLTLTGMATAIFHEIIESHNYALR